MSIRSTRQTAGSSPAKVKVNPPAPTPNERPPRGGGEMRGPVPPGGPVLTPALPASVRLASASLDALWSGDAKSSVLEVKTRAAFEALARRDDVPGAVGAREVKFLITGIDTPSPTVHFINTNKHAYHYEFAAQGLRLPLSLAEFNAQTYFTDRRKNLAGSLVAHDHALSESGDGLYTLEFWPTDPVNAAHVAKAFELISQKLPFARSKLRYHPAGETQEALFERHHKELESKGVKSIATTELFKSVTYSPLNAGVGFGMLRVVDPTQSGNRPPSVRDVVIFKSLPNDLPRVGGVISETPQTPLSHVNLRAKQNDAPNAYLKDATNDPKVAPLIGKLVRYEVGPDGLQLREATQAEADAWLESLRPAEPQSPPRNLSRKSIVDLDRLSAKDANAFGAKAANVGELRNVLAASQVPDGYGVPFSFYDEVMKANGLYEKAQAMMADPAFQRDAAVREESLRLFRREIRNATIPPALEAKISELQARFPPGTGIRCRSSTNNEDLPGFNGAGLYDSYTHRPDEGALSSTLKQVWASLWNYRAFEERELHRVDHLAAAMGVLVHPNFDDEDVNGVAVTKNIYDPNWPGFYVNAQVGESLVTNPDPSATPDELLISAIGPNGEWETQVLRRSTLTEGSKAVMTSDQVEQLRVAMEKIQSHFRREYRVPADDKTFAMDIEFKFDASGELVVKQARPWVE